MVTTRNYEILQMYEMVGASTEEATGKSSRACSILSTKMETGSRKTNSKLKKLTDV
jgi:hypothetical protein